MRFLHTSDWHLGRQFHNVSLLADQAYVLEQLIAIIKDQQVDAVLLAGDVFDRSVPPAQAVAVLDDVLNQICRGLNTPVLIIAGNHDGPERLEFGSRQMKGAGLHITGTLPQNLDPVVFSDSFGAVAVYSIPYTDPATVRQVYGADVSSHDQVFAYLLTHILQRHNPQQRSVVLGHLFLDGSETSESERPLSLGGLDQVSPRHFAPFNYAALGHLHGPQQRSKETIRYSGSLLKYSFSEIHHNKAVTLVEMDGKGACSLKQLALKPKRELRVIEGQLADILRQGASDPGKEDYLLVRLTDTHAILDIMTKLRAVYPNVLQLERPGLMAALNQVAVRREQLSRGELSLFKDFFKQLSGEELTFEQSTIIEQALAEIHKEESAKS